MSSVTLDQLNEKIERLTKLTLIGAKQVLDLDETALFTGMSIGHLYRLTSGREIPHFKKNRKLYFLKDELEKWMMEERIPTNKEVDQWANRYMATHK